MLDTETLYETSRGRNSEPQNSEYRTAEFRRMVSLRSVFFKQTEFIPSIFDIHYSIFDILFFRISFSIRLAAFLASGWADTYINYRRACCPSGATFPERRLGRSLGADLVISFIIGPYYFDKNVEPVITQDAGFSTLDTRYWISKAR